MRVDEICYSISVAFDRQISSTLINFELVQILMRVDERFRYARGNIQSTLVQLSFSFDRGMRVEETLACQLSLSTVQNTDAIASFS
jgi:hypothetical protein